MFQAAVPLEPIGRPRERHRIVRPKAAPGTAACRACFRPIEEPAAFVQSYTPESGDYGVWRKAALLLFRSVVHGRPPLEGPLGVRLVALFPMPAGEHRKREPRPRRWHTAKPDLDNVLKAVLDVAVEAGWMRDDAPVAQVEAQKIVAAQGLPPAVHVTLFALEPIVAPAPLLEEARGEAP